MNRVLNTIILTITCLIMVCGVYQVSAEEQKNENPNVLSVNGTLISKEQFNRELAIELNKDAGKSITEEELKAKVQTVLDKITKNELLYQECEKSAIVVTDDEINQKFDDEKGKFASTEEYEQSLKNQGKDDAIRKAEIKRNLAIQRLINQKFRPTITDDEVKQYYEANSDKLKDKPYDQFKEDIRKQLAKEKMADSYNKFCTEVRSKADVKVLIK